MNRSGPPIIPDGESECITLGARGHGPYRAIRNLDRSKPPLSALYIPMRDGTIPVNQHDLSWRDGQALRRSSELFMRATNRLVLCIVPEPQAGLIRLPITTRYEASPQQNEHAGARDEGQTRRSNWQALVKLSPVSRVPQPVVTFRDQQPAVRAECQFVYWTREAIQFGNLLPCVEVPYPDRAVFSPGGELLTIGAKRQTYDISVMRFHGLIELVALPKSQRITRLSPFSSVEDESSFLLSFRKARLVTGAA